jgi:hypothetical protein
MASMARLAPDGRVEQLPFASVASPALVRKCTGRPVHNATRRPVAQDGNACLEWLPIAFPFAEGPRVRIRLPPAVSPCKLAHRAARVLALGTTCSLSPRELAVRFTDSQSYFVSEASVYRLLKAHDLIASPAFIVIKVADAFKDKTSQKSSLPQPAPCVSYVLMPDTGDLTVARRIPPRDDRLPQWQA